MIVYINFYYVFKGIGERRLSEVNSDDLDVAWAVNARGPLMMVRHFAPLLTKANGLVGFKDAEGKPKHAAVVVSCLTRFNNSRNNLLNDAKLNFEFSR
jgi:hypothetical protein